MLDCVKGGYLLKNDQQLTSSMAIDRRGALYLYETTEVSWLNLLIKRYTEFAQLIHWCGRNDLVHQIVQCHEDCPIWDTSVKPEQLQILFEGIWRKVMLCTTKFHICNLTLQ